MLSGKQFKLQIVNYRVLVNTLHKHTASHNVCTFFFQSQVFILTVLSELALHCVLTAEIMKHTGNNIITCNIRIQYCTLGIEVKKQNSVFWHGVYNFFVHSPSHHYPNRIFIKIFIEFINNLTYLTKIFFGIFRRRSLMEWVTGNIMIIAYKFFCFFQKHSAKIQEEFI